MKKFLNVFIILFFLNPLMARASDDKALFLNAFGETATAYINDSFLLLGTTADGFVSEIIPRETALEIAKNVQRRIRVIRAKLKAISSVRMAEVDRQLIGLLDGAFACMDQQAWVLSQYVADKNPDAAKRFEEQRIGCLDRIGKIGEFYSTLPPAPELPEPLSTR
jgi:hypothetical protein